MPLVYISVSAPSLSLEGVKWIIYKHHVGLFLRSAGNSFRIFLLGVQKKKIRGWEKKWFKVIGTRQFLSVEEIRFVNEIKLAGIMTRMSSRLRDKSPILPDAQ